MIDALISGKLIKDPALKIGPSGKPYCNILLSVSCGDPTPCIVSAISFGDVAERLAKLKKGDAVTATGSLKPNEWTDKEGTLKHGLNLTVSSVLTAYDVKKRHAEAA